MSEGDLVPQQAPAGAAFDDPRSLRRREDHRFLTGAGDFLDDRPADGMLHAAVLRSPHAHARIVAIDSDAADKAARFLQLCDSYGFPVVSLVDTPGMMVGPDAEATGLVRHSSRLLVAGARLQVPLVGVVVRRGYGLGAQAMLGGSTHQPLLTVAWPDAHLGPMGLEGAVRLAMRGELEKIEDPAERERTVRELTAAYREHAKARFGLQLPLFDEDDGALGDEPRAF